jgi:hypothetical protein
MNAAAPRWKRFVKWVLWSIGVVVIGSIALGFWMFSGHGIDVQSFQKIKPGMAMSEVKTLMGSANTLVQNPEVGDFWIYGGNFKWCRGIVYFGHEGRVQSTFHEH